MSEIVKVLLSYSTCTPHIIAHAFLQDSKNLNHFSITKIWWPAATLKPALNFISEFCRYAAWRDKCCDDWGLIRCPFGFWCSTLPQSVAIPVNCASTLSLRLERQFWWILCTKSMLLSSVRGAPSSSSWPRLEEYSVITLCKLWSASPLS